jgi:hypothetical protein
MRIQRLLALGLLMFASMSAYAQTFFDPKFRAVVGVGRFDYRDYGFDNNGEQTLNFKSTAFDVAGGVELNRFLAAEVGVRVVKSSSVTYYDDVSVTNLEDRLNSTNFIQASVLGSLPLGETFSLIGRLGLLNWKMESEFIEHDLVTDEYFYYGVDKEDGTDLFYGVGVGFNMDGGQLRLEYQTAKLGDYKTAYATMGIVWRFGGSVRRN